MKIVKATERWLQRWPTKTRARKCPLCARAVRPGQHVAHHRLAASGFADTDLLLHVSCLRALVDGVAEDDVEPTSVDAQIAAIRREAISETRAA